MLLNGQVWRGTYRPAFAVQLETEYVELQFKASILVAAVIVGPVQVVVWHWLRVVLFLKVVYEKVAELQTAAEHLRRWFWTPNECDLPDALK